MTSPCDLYALPTAVWPQQQFPGDHPAVSRFSQGERLAAKRAWNYYEQVEAYDAAVRVRLGDTGGAIPPVPPGLWYQFNGEGQRALYEKGRRYHIMICPTYNWVSQRNRPFPVTTVDDVTPEDCPCVGESCSGDTVPILRNIPLPVSEPAPRSAQLIREGLSPPERKYNTITLVENTPSTPRSAATPTSVASPHTPGTPQSIKEPAPQLEVSEMRLGTDTPPPEPEPATADVIQLVA